LVTLAVVLVVALGAALGLAGLRLAELRSVPLAAPRALPVQGAGATTVEVSADAWAHSSGAAVRDLLARHFGAINTKNYGQWTSTVVSARVAQQPEAAWQQAYASTVDGTIRISRIIEESPGRLIALVSFVSTQRPESAPDDLKAPRICWRTAFTLVGEPPLIDVSRSGSLLRGAC
jgi:hypothetical protein